MNQKILHFSDNIKYILATVLLGLFIPSTLAQTANSTAINDKPISIDADNQQMDLKNNTVTFTGNVIIIQNGVEIKAASVVVTEINSKDNQIITASGKPVYFTQLNDNKKQEITGHANKLIYNVKQNKITMTGNAALFQQSNHILSDEIIYDVTQQKIVAQSNKGKRVKTTIIPSQVQEIKR